MESFYDGVINYMRENNLEEISIDDLKKFKKRLDLEKKIEYVAEQLTPEIFAGVIDHTYLKPYGTFSDINKLCEEAIEIKAGTVCVNECWVSHVCNILRDESINVASVIGFPLGSATSKIKAESATNVLLRGANEIDMVMNIGYLRERSLDKVYEEITGVIEAIIEVIKIKSECSQYISLKVIQENCYLSNEEKKIATQITSELGRKNNIHIFAKTSTGFGTPEKGPNGATIDDVILMHKVIGDYDPETNRVGIKAAGGIKDARTAIEMMIAAGCVDNQGCLKESLKDMFRIGTSSGKKLIEDFVKTYKS